MNEEKKEEEKLMRQFCVETDWTNIIIAKDETSWSLELAAILMKILNKIQ